MQALTATDMGETDRPSSHVERAMAAARLETLAAAVGAGLVADTSDLIQQFAGPTSLAERREVEQRLHALERAVESRR